MAARPQAPYQYPPPAQTVQPYPPAAPPPGTPGMPGMPGGAMPPSTSNKTLITIVVVVVVVIAAVAVGAMVLVYSAVSGLGPGGTPGGTPSNPTIVMQSGSWNGGNITVSITATSHANNLAPSALTYTVE